MGRGSRCTGTRTGHCRQLIAQEVEKLFGYDEAHTAPLLQEGAPGDCKDRGSVEARRLRALRRAWPVCFVDLVLQPAASHAEAEFGSPALNNVDLSTLPDLTVLLESYLACPYLCDRKVRGQSCQQVGPDWADMHAFQVAKPAGGIQHKSEGFAVSQERHTFRSATCLACLDE